ncbi:hypothetical protein DPEC_G00001010 [Dallia pectoralis]|uniref:Uncharacterized protein n=1 Tax=Dallia pectoralis TaxID=75939 RepID=A0ACC2HIM0_DALPE|nr:hypothetical protein DPEC_G00001010 [Dallia pectoralis]
MLNISPFFFGLLIQQVYDNGSVYRPEVLDITEAALHARFLEGVRNIASVCLEIGYPTLASISHTIINTVLHTMAAPGTTRELFTDAVRSVLETWPVLQIAVDNGFGGVYGQQKADWMVDVLQQYFYDNANLQQDEVEDYIADLMDNEFDTVVDDGSLSQVAESISQIFMQCQQGHVAEVKDKIAKLNVKRAERAKVTPQPNAADEESEDDKTESMECETAVSANSSSSATNQKDPSPQSQEEDDGWTTVVRKK